MPGDCWTVKDTIYIKKLAWILWEDLSWVNYQLCRDPFENDVSDDVAVVTLLALVDFFVRRRRRPTLGVAQTGMNRRRVRGSA